MARLRRGHCSAVAAFCSFLVFWPGCLAWAADRPATTLLYEQPVLTIDPGMHTAPIYSAAVDGAGQVAVTGSDDKTVRIWSLADGQLLRTIRVPAGPGDIGNIYAVALSPDGTLIAAGGWTLGYGDQPIYLFDRSTGEMTKRITGLPQVTSRLVFSANGRYLERFGVERNRVL